ncbi:MAG: RMD1 family protein, partial [Fimbriiglobus sp.]|nr:RMD1 family protein [Fimbriiglobus sp.]
MVVVEFGAVACWSPSAGEITTSAAQVEHALGLPSPSTGGDEQLSVRVNEPDDAVTFRDLRLKRLTREHLRLVSEVLAKSAALRAAEKLVDDTITQNAATVRQLSERGRIGSSSKQVLQAVGFTLAMRERLLARLNVFGTPPETWDSERLYKLYERLADHFDLRPRAAGLETKLEYLSDLSTTLLGFLEHREGKRLEWIVI